MKHYYYCIIVFIIIFLCNCKKKTNVTIENNLENIKLTSRIDSINNIENNIFPIYIDKDKEYEKKRLTIQEIGKVEYIKLETNDNCLISASFKLIGLYLTDKEIFLSTDNSILRFNKDGKFINSIGKRGQGPGEIKLLSDYIIDESKKEIYIWDGSTQNLKSYTYNGVLKNAIRLETYGENLGTICDSLIICTNYFGNNQPMAFLSSLNNGKTVKALLPSQTIKDETGLSMKFYNKYTENLLYNNKVIYQNFINDTIYTIDKKDFSVSLRYIQLPPNTGLDGKNSMPFVSFETDRYTYIIINKNPPLSHNFIIDKKENKIYRGFIGDTELRRSITPINTNKDNVIADLYDASTLTDYLSKNQLRGSLKEIAETLNDEDNPVLMIATIDF